MDKVNSIKMKKTEFKADGTIVIETDKIHNAIEIFLLNYRNIHYK